MIRGFRRNYLPGVAIAAGIALTAMAAEDDAPAPLCGQDLSSRDVLVLDVQHFLTDPDLADDYVIERAGNYRLADPLIDEVRMPFRPAVDPDGVIRVARKHGVKEGCDLVLILKTGPYFGRQRGRKARVKDHGYAFVATGQRVAVSP